MNIYLISIALTTLLCAVGNLYSENRRYKNNAEKWHQKQMYLTSEFDVKINILARNHQEEVKLLNWYLETKEEQTELLAKEILNLKHGKHQ